MKKLVGEIAIVIAISYTIISIIGGLINAYSANDFSHFTNTMMMFSWTAIAVIVLYTHSLFDKFPPLVTMIIQYLIALGLIMLFIKVGSYFEPVHPTGYWDAFVSFSIPYIIGASFFYYEVYSDARKANDLLKKLK